MGWFSKLTGIETPKFIEQTGAHAGSWAPQVAGTALTAVPGIGWALGPAVAGLGSGIHSYQSNGSIGKSALTGGINALGAAVAGPAIQKAGSAFMQGATASKAAGGGILGQIGSGIQKAAGFTPGVMKSTSSGMYPSINGIVISTVPGAAQTATLPSGASAVSNQGLGTLASNIGETSLPVSTNWGSGLGSSSVSQTPSVSAPFNPVSPSPKSDMGKSPFNIKTALGGASMLGSLIPQTPKFTMPDSVGNIRSQLMSGNQLTSLGKDAQAEISRIMNAKAEELYPVANDAYYNAALKRTRDSYSAAEEELDKSYNLAGMYGTGEHLAAKADLKNELAQAESALAAQTEQQRFELAQNAKLQAISQALNVDQATMADLVGLSGLDVQTAAMMYGANVEDVQQIRQALGTLGTNLISSGMGVNNGQNQIISKLLGS